MGWGVGGDRETQFLCLRTIKRAAHPHSLYFTLACELLCVCVGGWEGWGEWMGGGGGGAGGGGAVAVMCLTDIEDNCALSSSCLCNSTTAAA